ncbi:hypothetical protein AA103196_1208 [Ameyamaea chiangmaiensis NBRC 103196]|uniref:Uncharacterized protein n=1 Tax=Ameyamaea chiangmaiensis TaxID=442969 RepID=A0A850PCQ4_9PROT|nr:hypothetical protein [Ameyamaea chiangmaiensis]MBS4075024.1 hypothetical protein [Ameyamaea chiangmaiensis]NVN40066.1 hypothetical protein [Ameyamaea chiangmaiensis]GBQ65739.1 hypothetical protein AA103196_1208 [Ameyamaea chiangmaiensis NBRC 103196]
MTSPVMSVCGAHGVESANTLDGMPMQNLLDGRSGAYLNRVFGDPFILDQIDRLTLYPDVGYPDQFWHYRGHRRL